MKKYSTQKLSKRLAKYGALSMAIAGVADATGQVVYTDIDPDFEGALTDVFDIDFNDDGVVDISITQSNNGNYELVQATPVTGNGVIAASNSGYFYASVLSASDAIDAGAGSFRSFGSLCAGPGYLGSVFCAAGEGFIGVEFDVDGETHYGWVQLAVSSSSAYEVRDYAFDATPDATIAAGDAGAVGIIEIENSLVNHFLDANGQLVLNSEAPMASVVITDVLGKQVMSIGVSSSNERIDLNSLSAGTYIVTVMVDNERTTFKMAK